MKAAIKLGVETPPAPVFKPYQITLTVETKEEDEAVFWLGYHNLELPAALRKRNVSARIVGVFKEILQSSFQAGRSSVVTTANLPNHYHNR